MVNRIFGPQKEWNPKTLADSLDRLQVGKNGMQDCSSHLIIVHISKRQIITG